MAKYGLNRVTLIGNLSADPEVRQTEAGVTVTTLRLACTEPLHGRDGREADHTEWLDVVLWRSQAETARDQLRKGATVCIEGRLRSRQWEAPGGAKRSRIEIEATRLLLLESRPAPASAYTLPAVPPTAAPDVPPADEDLPF
ncbi:MAG: single-stranded DNA-binding protein [Bacteroidia bacterium]|nr:single-stranded DNA-binding protein [Bacteroidia bacterium]